MFHFFSTLFFSLFPSPSLPLSRSLASPSLFVRFSLLVLLAIYSYTHHIRFSRLRVVHNSIVRDDDDDDDGGDGEDDDDDVDDLTNSSSVIV